MVHLIFSFFSADRRVHNKRIDGDVGVHADGAERGQVRGNHAPDESPRGKQSSEADLHRSLAHRRPRGLVCPTVLNLHRGRAQGTSEDTRLSPVP